MYQDIRRICEAPTDEDRAWFPEIAGSALAARRCDFAMRNFKDESFIAQYLSPKLMRDFRLFAIHDDDRRRQALGRRRFTTRAATARCARPLSEQYNLGSREPNIQVWNVDLRGDRSLTLRHTRLPPPPARRQHQRGPCATSPACGASPCASSARAKTAEIQLLHEIRGETTRPRTPA